MPEMMLPQRRTAPVVAAVAFVLLMVLAVTAWQPLAAIDAAVGDWFRRYGTDRPDVVAVVRIATDVASTVVYVAAGLLLTAVLAVRRRRPAARFVAAVTVAVPVLWSLLHRLLEDPRPDAGFVTVSTNGFPSGHTSNAAAAAVLAVVLCGPLLGRTGRAVLVVAATVFALAIGLTRLVLLAHWPSQVLGGWLLALAVVPSLARWAGAGRIGSADRPAARADRI
jgi:undecaprenyl-diphosphatase